MTNILIVSQYWAPDNGVPQRRWAWLTDQLLDLGCTITVITPIAEEQRSNSLRQWLQSWGFRGEPVKSEGLRGERIYRSGYIPTSSSLSSRAIGQAWSAGAMILASLMEKDDLKKIRPDVVVGTVPAIPTAFVARFVARLLRVPYVIDLRDAWPDLLAVSHRWNEATGTMSFREKLIRRGPLRVVLATVDRLLRSSLLHATAVITTSASHAQKLETEFQSSLSSVRPSVICVRNVFRPQISQPFQVKNEKKADSLKILYAGTIGRAQGLENAIKGAQIAADKGMDVELRFVGNGAGRSVIANRAQDSRVKLSVLEATGADNLRAHYEWADTALVHLTDWDALSVSVPSKLYELMELGIYVTGVVKGESAELIRDLGAGSVVDPNDFVALGNLWAELAKAPSPPVPDDRARQWVIKEREERTQNKLRELLLEVSRRARN